MAPRDRRIAVMNRTLTLLVALSVLAGGIVPAVAAAQPAGPAAVDGTDPSPQLAGPAAQTDENATDGDEATDGDQANDSVAPGARLAGAIGAQEAELKGEVEQRTFGRQVAAAATDASKARVIARNQERLQERLEGFQERFRALERARANGSISQSQYRAQVTEMAARTATVRHMANTTERAAEGLPADALAANGVNVTALRQIRTRAQEMTGPEIAQIARQIAGPDVGQRMGPPEDRPGGPPDDRPGGPENGGQGGHDDGQRGDGSNGGSGSNSGQGGGDR